MDALNKDLLAQILVRSNGGMDQDGYSMSQSYRNGGGDDSNSYVDQRYVHNTAPDDGGMYDTWDASTGDYLGRESKKGQVGLLDLAKGIAALWGFALGGQALMGAGGAGAGAGAGLGEGAAAGLGEGMAAFNPALDSQMANLAIEQAGGNALAGYTSMAGTTGITGIPGPGLLSQFLDGASSLASKLGTAKGLAGLATTVGGGLLGSKGAEEGFTKTNKIDPRMEPYIYGQNGILNDATNLYKSQMAQGGMNDWMRQGLQTQAGLLTDPAVTQGYRNLANTGQGLLSMGVAPNPFNSGR